jgi:glycosyltransferase involved in cell wall biosynthesis
METYPVELSIVFPVYNEAGALEELYHRTRKVLNALGKSSEIIFVDDGSRDNSVEVLKRVTAGDPTVSVITLRRNFGQTPALAAGFDAARGAIIIAMDADLQHDPEEIPQFLAKIDEGYDVVSGWREKRVDNLVMRRIPSMIANRMMRKLSGVDVHDFGTTYKAYRAEVIKEVRLYGELHRFIPALASSVGAKICELPIRNIERPHGKSNYGIGRTIRVLFDLMTVRFLLKYLHRPLQLFGLIGLSCFGVGFISGAIVLWRKFISGVDVFAQHGPLLLLSTLMVILSISFVSMGLLGEVMSRVYFEAADKRIYHVREIWHGAPEPRKDENA